MNELVSWKRLNAWQIKLLMTFLMVLNHLEFVYGFYSDNLQTISVFISRCVAPMFAYLAIEGITHTRSLKKYCLRLWVWVIVVFLGNILLGYLLKNLAVDFAPANQVYLTVRTNITITLATGVSCIAFIIWGKKKEDSIRFLFFGLSIVFFIIGFIFEWGIVLLPFMLATYFLREKRQKRYLSYLVIEAVAFLLRSEIYYFLVFPLIALYNGERGPNNKFNKYFFYTFYPLHLWLIAIVNFIILSR